MHCGRRTHARTPSRPCSGTLARGPASFPHQPVVLAVDARACPARQSQKHLCRSTSYSHAQARWLHGLAIHMCSSARPPCSAGAAFFCCCPCPCLPSTPVPKAPVPEHLIQSCSGKVAACPSFPPSTAGAACCCCCCPCLCRVLSDCVCPTHANARCSQVQLHGRGRRLHELPLHHGCRPSSIKLFFCHLPPTVLQDSKHTHECVLIQAL